MSIKYKYPKLFSLTILLASWLALYGLYYWFTIKPDDNDDDQVEISDTSIDIDENTEGINLKAKAKNG